MSAWLYSIGKWCFTHRRTVLGAWLAALILLGGAGAAFMGTFEDNFDIPSSRSQEALEKLRMTFPQGAALSAMAVIVLPEGESVVAHRPVIEQAVADFEQLDEVEPDGATSPWNEHVEGLVSDDERAALIQLQLAFGGVTPSEADLAPITEVAEQLETKLPAGSEVAMGGEAYNIELPALSLIEVIGLGVALVVLTVLLGSLVAAGLPLLTAITGVGITTAIMLLLTRVFDINSTTPILSVMLGLAVGIDYALFILSRHRDLLREGLEPEESAGRAVGTSGSAVVFAGLTVFIALLGLAVANIPFLTVMGIFAAVGVALAVVVALTMLPALMGFMGERMRPKPRRVRKSRAALRPDGARSSHRSGSGNEGPALRPDGARSSHRSGSGNERPALRPALRPEGARSSHPSGSGTGASSNPSGSGTGQPSGSGTGQPSGSGTGAFGWWVGVTTKHPVATIVAVVVGLVTLTVPTVGLQVSLPNAGQQPEHRPARIAYDLMATHFGEGVNGPLVVTADIIGTTDPLGVMAGLKADIEQMDGVASVPLSTPNMNADTGLIQVVPTTGPTDPATADLVRALIDRHDQWMDEYGVNTNVTGMTAVQIDISDKLTKALLPFGLLVVGLSLVLLAAVFRSVWVPVKATLGYLLSVGAAFGATTLVFNHGWFKEVVNLERAMPVISFLPILLMGILFGLAMDYEVFLVSRIREEYVHGKSARDAIRSGFVASGPVVAAAAMIMIAVFAFFVPEGMLPIKAIAFSLAIGVAVDAFLVRMTLVPAVMTLLGDRAWWLPSWLDRALPVFDVEGEVLSKEMELKDWPGDGSLVHADRLAVDGIVAPLSLRVLPGQVLGVVGPVGPRTGTLLALSGRLQTTAGRARVAGALLPEGAGRARRRVTYLDLAHTDDPAAALQQLAPGSVVVIDSVDRLGNGTAPEALTALIDRTREEGAVLLGATAAEHLSHFPVDGVLNAAAPLHEEARA